MGTDSKLIGASSLTVTRYTVYGELPKNFWAWARERVEKFAFRDIDDTADVASAGWVSIENMFAAAHANEGFTVGDYIVMTMRIDERKVAASVIKKFCGKREAQEKKDKEIPKIPRWRKTEIKEQVTQELTKRAVPDTQLHDMAWNLDEGVVYLCTHTNAAKEVFESLFKECFEGLVITEDIHATAALRLLGDGAQETLKGLRAVAFDTGSQVGQFGIDFAGDLVNIAADGHFLGKEFLTWLRYRAMHLPEALPLPVTLLPDVCLEFGDEKPEKVACKGGKEQPEVFASLKDGKQIEAARVAVIANDFELVVTIKADRLRLSAINLPKAPPISEDQEGMEGRILDRIGQVEMAHNLVDQLFKTFMSVRTDEALWFNDVHTITRWLEGYEEAMAA